MALVPDIDVSVTPRDDGWSFSVTVSEGASRTSHNVTLSSDVYQQLTGGASPPELLVRESFAFLLEREPKESILREFDITVISRYFPEYEAEIHRRVQAGP